MIYQLVVFIILIIYKMELDTMSNNSSNLAASENRAVNSSNMMTSMLSNSENANE